MLLQDEKKLRPFSLQRRLMLVLAGGKYTIYVNVYDVANLCVFEPENCKGIHVQLEWTFDTGRKTLLTITKVSLHEEIMTVRCYGPGLVIKFGLKSILTTGMTTWDEKNTHSSSSISEIIEMMTGMISYAVMPRLRVQLCYCFSRVWNSSKQMR